MDHSSKTVRLKADELLAQALEHEVDHLNGILYVDHLASHEKLIPVTPEPEEDEDETPAEEPPPALVAAGGVDPRETPATLKVG